jgi:hypothetical protein
VKESKMGGVLSIYGGGVRNAYRIIVGNPEEKRQIRRQRLRWEDNIIMDLRKIGWEVVNWIHLAHDRDHMRAVVITIMNPWAP